MERTPSTGKIGRQAEDNWAVPTPSDTTFCPTVKGASAGAPGSDGKPGEAASGAGSNGASGTNCCGFTGIAVVR